VDAFNPGIYDPEEVRTLVEDAQEINANALIVQVGRRFDCFCNEALFPRTDAAIDPAPYDPLAEVVEQAHAAGIEVHAWVNATTLWNSATPPESPEHAFNQHGLEAEGSDRWLNKRVDGTELVGDSSYLDPANPDAVDYVVDGVRSLLAEYDLDGINLDYIYLGMYDVDPQARLSINGITYDFGPQTHGGWEQTRPYTDVLQDWKAWLAEGIIDTNVAMNYKRDWMDDQAQMFDEWNEALANWQYDRQTVNGPGIFLNGISESVRQARETFEPTETGNTMVGWSGYAYASPSLDAGEQPGGADAERERLAHALTEEDPDGNEPLFEQDAAVPSMPWKEQPSNGHVNVQVGLRSGSPLDGAQVSLQQPGSEQSTVTTQVTDGSGWAGFVDVAPGRWKVVLERPDDVLGPPVSIVTVEAGTITDVELDRLRRR